MKKLFAALIALGVAAAVQAAPLPQGDAVAGESKAATCAACHGPNGNSMAPTFPRLAGQNAKYTFKQLQDFKAGRRLNPTMQGIAAALSEQDMADLGAYFAQQQSGLSAANAELASKGERLFRGGNPETGLAPCSGCHNPAGKGNAPAGFPRLAGQQAEYTKAQLRSFRAAGRNDTVADPAQKRINDAAKAGETGPMQMVAAKLSDAEVDALAAFISGLH